MKYPRESIAFAPSKECRPWSKPSIKLSISLCAALCIGVSGCPSPGETWDAVVEVADDVIVAIGHLANIGTGGAVGQGVGLATSAVDQCKKYIGDANDVLEESEESGDTSDIDNFMDGFDQGLHSLDGANAIDSLGYFIDICDDLVDSLSGTEEAQSYLTREDYKNMYDVKALVRKSHKYLDQYSNNENGHTASTTDLEASESQKL
jgi:hypothetical protein